MMTRLHRTALKFDKTPCKDAYTGSLSFYGQILPWDESTRDSEAAQRRVISTAPGTAVPLRNAVSVGSEVFILGIPHYDQWKGTDIRAGYPSVKADGLALVQTLDELCRATGGTQMYASAVWVKDDAFSEQNSKLNPKFHLHVARNETIEPGFMVTLGMSLYLVRASFPGVSGIQSATADEVESPSVELGVVESSTYDPVTDSTATTSSAVRMVALRWQSLYEYKTKGAPTFAPGDQQVAVSKSAATPKPGDIFVMSTGRWTVASVVDEAGVWLCKVSRAG